MPLIEPADEHNRTLEANVHPAGWTNPEPGGRYNLVALGAGTAGLISAVGAAGLGARAALVERHLMGGDCLNVGCVPSKALLRAARAAADARGAGDFGVRVPPGVEVDFPRVMERMRRLRAQISKNDSAARYRGLGVDVFLGEGRFTGPDSLEVGGKTLRFARAVIATGGRPAAPPIPGLAEAGYLTNETVFSLTRLPRRLAVIGGGPIGCELAQAFARFGSKVALLQSAPQILHREDPDAARIIEGALAQEGVAISVDCRIECVETRGAEKVLRAGAAPLSVDEILVAAGRKPNVEGLGLEAAGVRFDPAKGVSVDDALRTSNPRIFAAGDCCFPFQFTHAADATARIVIQNALFPGPRKKANALTIPWCTYTDPEIAHVGLYEKEARERGFEVETFRVELGEVDRAVLDGEERGFLKVHAERGSGRLLGATMVSRHAGETIGELSLAITAGLGLGDLARTIHPYPTQAEALKRAGDAFNRTRLTPFVKSALGAWLKWRR